MINIKLHPIYILFSIKKFLFLLIIPLIRGLIYYIINSNLYSWFQGSWIDISILMTIIGLAITKWHNYNISINQNDNNLILSSGIFVNKNTVISPEKISLLSANIPVYYKIINAVNLEINVFSSSNVSSKIKLILSKKNFNLIKSDYLKKTKIFQNLDLKSDFNLDSNSHDTANKSKKNNFINNYNFNYSSTIQSIFLSLIMSNSLAGIIFVSTFISTAGKILGYKLENELYGHFTLLAKKLAFGLPPAGAVIAYLLIIGWLIAFFKNLIFYLNFNLKKNNNYLKTSTGFLSTNMKYIDINHIDHIDIIQNLFTKTINLSSVFVKINNNKHSIVIVPATKMKNLEKKTNNIFNQKIQNIKKTEIKPSKTSVFSYISEPILAFSVMFWVLRKLKNTYPKWTDFLFFIAAMLSIIFFWLLIIKLINFFSCGISCQNNNFIIKQSKLFKFHTIIIPKNKIIKLEIRQNPSQKLFKKFDVVVHSSSQHLSVFKLKNLNFSEIKNLKI